MPLLPVVRTTNLLHDVAGRLGFRTDEFQKQFLGSLDDLRCFVERTSRISSVLMMDLQGLMIDRLSCDAMIAVSTESRLDGMMM